MLPIAILAGGFATRLGELTQNLPKCLLKINGRPFIDWQLELLINAGYRDFVFCISYKSDLVQNYLGDGSRWNSRFRYSFDGDQQLGTGGAILKALPLLGSQFAVIYGDSYLPIDYSEIEVKFLQSGTQSLMTVYENRNSFDSSNVEYQNGRLINYEKGQNNSNMTHIDYGLSYFQASAFETWTGPASFDLSVLSHKLAVTKNLDGIEVFNRFYEIGSIQGIKELSEYLGRDLK
jgi:N-acetyl-alpha-D-muramate 1-phosphate uridylyltransferase